jgi:hypothetical protein
VTSYTYNIITTPLGTYLWTKLCCILFCLVYAFIVNINFIHITHALYIGYRLMPSSITCFKFLENTQTFMLGRGLMICLIMTIGKCSSLSNTQLIFKCLLGNNGYTWLNCFLKCPYTVLTRTITGQIWNLLRLGRKPTHASLND